MVVAHPSQSDEDASNPGIDAGMQSGQRSQIPAVPPRHRSLTSLNQETQVNPRLGKSGTFNYGDESQSSISPDLLEEIRLNRRAVAETLLAKGSHLDQFQASCLVMKISCSLKKKYEQIDFLDLLQRNKSENVHRIPMAFTILAKYACNLLKPEDERHMSWRSVQFTAHGFQQKVNFLNGCVDILKTLGYSQEFFGTDRKVVGIRFPFDKIVDAGIVLELAVDLTVGKFEVDAMLLGTHPQLHNLRLHDNIPIEFFPLQTYEDENMADEIPEKIEYALNKPSCEAYQPTLSPQTQTLSSPQSSSQASKSNQTLNFDEQEPKHFSSLPFERPDKSVDPMRRTYSDGDMSMQPLCTNCHAVVDTAVHICLNCGHPIQKSKPSKNDKAPVASPQTAKGGKVPSEGWHCKHCSVFNTGANNICFVCHKASQVEDSVAKELGGNNAFTSEERLLAEKMVGKDEIEVFRWLLNDWPKLIDNVQIEVNMLFGKDEDVGPISREKCKEILLEFDGDKNKVAANFARKKSYAKQEIIAAQEPGGKNAFTSEEHLLAEMMVGKDKIEVVRWLLNDWPKLIDDVKIEVNMLFGKDEDFGPISREKCKEMLLEFDGDRNKVAANFATKKSGARPQIVADQKEAKIDARSPVENDDLIDGEKIIADQKEMEKNARRLVYLMKVCEREGFTPEECLLAAQKVGHTEEGIFKWLRSDWQRLIDDSLMDINKLSQANENVGPMSRLECKGMLLEFDGDKKKVALTYPKWRTGKVLKLAALGEFIAKKDVVDALHKVNGDEEKARDLLDRKRLEKYQKHLLVEATPGDYFARLLDDNVPIEVRCRMIMVENDVSWGRAENFFKLRASHIEVAMDRLEGVKNCLEAVKNCQYYDQCRNFLDHECCICLYNHPVTNIMVGLECQCEVCFEDYAEYINCTLREKHVRQLVCPSCSKPDIENVPDTYFSNLQQQILNFVKKGLLDSTVLDMFDRKLLDFNLQKQENFRWCTHCENGFLWEDLENFVITCNKCNKQMCYLCKEKWMEQHNNITCEDFKNWKEANDPTLQEAGVMGLLAINGLECPGCHFRYDLAHGGCIHFTCRQCQYEFCCGCFQPFRRGLNCKVDPSCAHKGIHAHHPRNCLYYLRDTALEKLEAMLHDHEVEWKRALPEDMQDEEKPVCVLMLQKELEDGRFKDECCGKDAPKNMAGFCEEHYKEYLVKIIKKNRIDPIEQMTKDEMERVLAKNFKPKLEQLPNEADEAFEERMRKYLVDEVPLPK